MYEILASFVLSYGKWLRKGCIDWHYSPPLWADFFIFFSLPMPIASFVRLPLSSPLHSSIDQLKLFCFLLILRCLSFCGSCQWRAKCFEFESASLVYHHHLLFHFFFPDASDNTCVKPNFFFFFQWMSVGLFGHCEGLGRDKLLMLRTVGTNYGYSVLWLECIARSRMADKMHRPAAVDGLDESFHIFCHVC